MHIHVFAAPTRPLFPDEQECDSTWPAGLPAVLYHSDAVRVIEGHVTWYECLRCGMSTKRRRT